MKGKAKRNAGAAHAPAHTTSRCAAAAPAGKAQQFTLSDARGRTSPQGGAPRGGRSGLRRLQAPLSPSPSPPKKHISQRAWYHCAIKRAPPPLGQRPGLPRSLLAVEPAPLLRPINVCGGAANFFTPSFEIFIFIFIWSG